MELKIEKGVPIPERGWGLPKVLRNMEKGDSVFVPGRATGSVSSSALLAFGKGGFRIHKEEGGVRVWRIK